MREIVIHFSAATCTTLYQNVLREVLVTCGAYTKLEHVALIGTKIPRFILSHEASLHGDAFGTKAADHGDPATTARALAAHAESIGGSMPFKVLSGHFGCAPWGAKRLDAHQARDTIFAAKEEPKIQEHEPTPKLPQVRRPADVFFIWLQLLQETVLDIPIRGKRLSAATLIHSAAMAGITDQHATFEELWYRLSPEDIDERRHDRGLLPAHLDSHERSEFNEFKQATVGRSFLLDLSRRLTFVSPSGQSHELHISHVVVCRPMGLSVARIRPVATLQDTRDGVRSAAPSPPSF